MSSRQGMRTTRLLLRQGRAKFELGLRRPRQGTHVGHTRREREGHASRARRAAPLRWGWLGRDALLESFLSAAGVPSQRPCCRSAAYTSAAGGGEMAWGTIDRSSVEAEVDEDWVKPTKLVKVQGSRARGR
jgi:hypothetical protein